jgi:hypothetical protein
VAVDDRPFEGGADRGGDHGAVEGYDPGERYGITWIIGVDDSVGN